MPAEVTLPTLLLLAALPAAGQIAGAFTAEWRPPSERAFSIFLHAAVGVVFAAVAVEVLPAARAVGSPWAILTGFLAGGLSLILIERWAVGRRPSPTGAEGEQEGDPRALYLLSFVDLLADGILIGSGALFDLRLGLLLALAQLPADFPEGYATVAALRRGGVSRRGRILAAVSLVLPVFVAALLSYYVLRSLGQGWTAGALAFASGALLTVIVEEAIPEAHARPDPRGATLAFLGGFGALFVASILSQG